jgi:hypothetical protein
VSSPPPTNVPERRSSQRFLIECDVRYRVLKIEEFGSGKTVNMSASGILITTDRVLSPGLLVEVEIDWPVKAADGVPLKLFVQGQIVRSNVALASVKILRYTFPAGPH